MISALEMAGADSMMIEGEVDLGIDHRGRLMAVRALGKTFTVLASISALVGILWVADSFRSAIRQDPRPNETTGILGMLLAPVALAVGAPWLLFRIGQGLQRLASWSRWAAVAVLVPACIPPLVFFFSAVRGQVYERAALMLALTIPPALGALLLASSAADPLFNPKSKEARKDSYGYPSWIGSRSGLVIKVFMTVITLAAMIALIALSH
jgi:hypothetical protein